MAGGFGSFAAARFGLRRYNPTPSRVRAITFGGTWGSWQGLGWGSISYLAALSGLDPELYESASVDGANRMQMALRVTLPALIPVMTILLLLQIGNILEQGWDQIFNLYNDVVVSVSDVFETLVYRSGIEGAKYSYATAINLFQNVVGFVLLIAANQIVRRYNEYSIW